MKRKYYIRGIGVGILFATIILMTAYAISGGKKLSDEEIIKRAEELGMVKSETLLDDLVKPADTEVNTGDPVKNTESPLSTSEDITATTNTDVTTNEDATVNTDTAATTEDTATEASGSTENTRMVSFTVVSGMSSWNVATILKDQGVIEDASEFDSYLVENGYSSRINVGEYSVSVGADYDTIAKLITGR